MWKDATFIALLAPFAAAFLFLPGWLLHWATNGNALYAFGLVAAATFLLVAVCFVPLKDDPDNSVH